MTLGHFYQQPQCLDPLDRKIMICRPISAFSDEYSRVSRTIKVRSFPQSWEIKMREWLLIRLGKRFKNILWKFCNLVHFYQQKNRWARMSSLEIGTLPLFDKIKSVVDEINLWPTELQKDSFGWYLDFHWKMSESCIWWILYSMSYKRGLFSAHL